MARGQKKEAMLPQFSPEVRAQAGSDKVKYIPATAIFDLQQIREYYDAEELQELADRIPLEVTDEGAKLDLMHAVTVAEFDDRAALEVYLQHHAVYYEYPYDESIIDSIPLVDDYWHVRVSGHRRGRAIALKCAQNGIPIEQVDVCSTVIENPSFDDARRKQFVENTTSLIQPAEDAKAMWREYKYRWGVPPSILIDRATELARLRIIADYMAFGEEKVQNGLLYSSMPTEITQFQSRGLTYSNVVKLAWLYRAYAEEKDMSGYPRRTVEDACEETIDYFKSSIAGRLHGKSTRQIGEKIAAKTREVKQQSDYLTGELFLVDEVAQKKERKKKIGREVVDAVKLLLSAGMVDFEEADLPEIVDLLEKARRELGAKAVVDIDSEAERLFSVAT